MNTYSPNIIEVFILYLFHTNCKLYESVNWLLNNKSLKKRTSKKNTEWSLSMVCMNIFFNLVVQIDFFFSMKSLSRLAPLQDLMDRGQQNCKFKIILYYGIYFLDIGEIFTWACGLYVFTAIAPVMTTSVKEASSRLHITTVKVGRHDLPVKI